MSGGELVVPIALRLSGQLLLGVARMYSRKAKYLMDDATETLSKVKLAFRQGASSRNKDVDLAADQQTAHRNAITHQANDLNEFDLIYQDMAYRNWYVLRGVEEGDIHMLMSRVPDVLREDALEAELAATAVPTPSKNRKRTTATNAEITLPDHDLDFETGARSGFDFDLDFAGRGIDSQQFAPEDFDLDLDLDLSLLPHERIGHSSDRAMSVELGRDAPSSAARKSNAAPSSPLSHLGGMDIDLDGAGGGAFGDQTMDQSAGFDQGAADFEFEAGANFDFRADEPGQTSESSPSALLLSPPAHHVSVPSAPRALSPLTDLGAAAEPEQQQGQAQPQAQDGETTPQPLEQSKKRKAKAPQKQIIDAVTELESPSKRARNSQQSGENAALTRTDLTAPPEYLPRDPARLRLMQLDVNAYLPQLDASKQFFCLPGAAALAPELQDLFKFEARSHSKRRQGDENDSPRKKQARREESPELGRRAELPPMSEEAGFEFEAGAGGADFDASFDVGGLPADQSGEGAADFSHLNDGAFQFEVGSQKSQQRDASEPRSRSASVFSARSAASRRSNLFAEEDTMPRGDANSLLAPFDDLRLGSSSSSANHSRDPSKSPAKSQVSGEDEAVMQGKWSKSSRVAIQILNQELAPGTEGGAAGQAPAEDKTLSFEHAADKVRLPFQTPQRYESPR